MARPLTVRAAHTWAARTLKGVDFKGGTGEWILSLAAGDVGSSAPPAGTPLEDSLAPGAMASSSALVGTPLVATPPSGATAPPSFPASPSLKILRGGALLSETADRYSLGRELGQGTFGKVYEATSPLLQGRRFAVKRFSAEDARQARLDAIEDATPPQAGSFRRLRGAVREAYACTAKPCVWHISRLMSSDFASAENVRT